MSDTPLSPRQRAALHALCRALAPAACSSGDGALAALVETRLSSADARLRDDVRLALELFDHPLSAALSGCAPRRFAVLPAAEQDARLAAWETSRVPLRRTIFQALRRLVFSTWYSQDEAQREIGYLGPLHEREPAVAWEGPLSGLPDDAEPVARGGARPRAPTSIPAGIRQGRELGGDTTLRADICVIGTGAGGAVAAARFAEAGRDVVLLEEGGYWPPEEFTERERDMVPRLYADGGARVTDDLSVAIFQGRCVGGSTTLNWLIMLRAHERVLDEWALEHGTEGMSAAELAPVFDEIEHEVHARPVPDDAHSPINRAVLDGAAKLGWSARAATINARECVRAGTCGVGCRYGAKQGTLMTFVPRALAAGARLYTDTRVDRIVRVERGGPAPVKRVECTVLDRESGAPRGRLTVHAPIVVLGAGAVGTPAILQRSGMGGGGVGRYLRLHPTSVVIGEYDRAIHGAAGVPLSSICDEFLNPGGYGFWIECAAFLPALASVAVPGFGTRHRAVMERFRGIGAMIILVRDGADRARSHGDVIVDRRGRTHIRYRLGAAERLQMIEGLQAAARLHFASGAREALTLHARECRLRSERDIGHIAHASYGPNDFGLFSAHVNGTCRIGRDPRTSGCTSDGERHGVPGLYVADGSLVPTAPGVNPQETIMALATVIARRILDRHPSS